MASPSTRLDATHVIATIDRLEARIGARFEGRGLYAVAGELRRLAIEVVEATYDARGRLRMIRVLARLLTVVVAVATLVALVLVFEDAEDVGREGAFAWLPLIESTVNDVVFAAIAVFFLYALPNRLVRGRLLRYLHRLRSLAHIVDMHQLTKDPERLRDDFRTTPESAVLDLDRAEMEHYLDYCSELLSMVSKVAALCAEESQDAVILDTVSTIEVLTVGMSRKIWQKIGLLSRQ